MGICRHRKRVARAHFDTKDKPIMSSLICCCCEADTAHRMSSFMAARESGRFDGGPRKPLADGGRCQFCRRRCPNLSPRDLEAISA